MHTKNGQFRSLFSTIIWRSIQFYRHFFKEIVCFAGWHKVKIKKVTDLCFSKNTGVLLDPRSQGTRGFYSGQKFSRASDDLVSRKQYNFNIFSESYISALFYFLKVSNCELNYFCKEQIKKTMTEMDLTTKQ